MWTRFLKIASAALCCLALVAQTGCCCPKGKHAKQPCGKPCGKPCPESPAVADPCPIPAGELSAELPPNAKSGECWAKVWIPPTFKTVSQRILVKEASEQIEVIPAKYEWVEERIVVKDASTELVTVPAQYGTRDVTVQTATAHTDWEVNKVPCETPAGSSTKDVFCLIDHPPQHATLQTQTVVKPPQVQAQQVPAQYETVRRERLVQPATTRRIAIPAEYQNVEKTVKVCDGRMAWQRVDCDIPGATKVQPSAMYVPLSPSAPVATAKRTPKTFPPNVAHNARAVHN